MTALLHDTVVLHFVVKIERGKTDYLSSSSRTLSLSFFPSMFFDFPVEFCSVVCSVRSCVERRQLVCI